MKKRLPADISPGILLTCGDGVSLSVQNCTKTDNLAQAKHIYVLSILLRIEENSKFEMKKKCLLADL